MKAVFMGTPEFAVPTLQALIDHHEVLAVVTQPDKQRGRGKKVQFPPVKEKAGNMISQYISHREPEMRNSLKS